MVNHIARPDTQTETRLSEHPVVSYAMDGGEVVLRWSDGAVWPENRRVLSPEYYHWLVAVSQGSTAAPPTASCLQIIHRVPVFRESEIIHLETWDGVEKITHERCVRLHHLEELAASLRVLIED